MSIRLNLTNLNPDIENQSEKYQVQGLIWINNVDINPNSLLWAGGDTSSSRV